MLCQLRNGRFALKWTPVGRILVFLTHSDVLSEGKWSKYSSALRHDSKRHLTNSTVSYQKVEKLKIENHKNYIKESELEGISLDLQKKILTVQFGQSFPLKFPVIWLRDNCQCQQCFDPTSSSRIIDLQLFRDDSLPKITKVHEDHISILWDDDHESVFTNKWLEKHSFDENHQMKRLHHSRMVQVPWKAMDFNNKTTFHAFQFFDVMNSNYVLLEWLEALATFGVALLRNTPLETGKIKELADRVGFLRKTHYGTEFFVQGVENAVNVAYRTGPLQLHTDLPYYHFMPGIVLLHCIVKSSTGGENVLSDGLHAIKLLDTKDYEVLCKTIVDWVDIGSHEGVQFHSLNRSPVICLDRFGQLEKINWSQPQRGSEFNVSIKEAIEWYGAVRKFTKILHNPENAVILKTEPGDILTFDNRRILHGRLDYRDGKRLLSGGYLDWDEVYSRIRVLKLKLEK